MMANAFDWSRVTKFQRKVYEALLEIPCGTVTTYGLLAKRIGCASPRAVGQALGENPFAPAVPCHRVIAATLGLGGFSHQTSGAALQRKVKLLRQEGVLFNKSGRLADPRRLWAWSAKEPQQTNDS